MTTLVASTSNKKNFVSTILEPLGLSTFFVPSFYLALRAFANFLPAYYTGAFPNMRFINNSSFGGTPLSLLLYFPLHSSGQSFSPSQQVFGIRECTSSVFRFLH